MSPSRAVHYLLIAGLLLVIGLSPFAFGAVHPIFYSGFQIAVLLLLAVTCVWYSLAAQNNRARGFGGFFLLGACFAAISAIQLFPLPGFLARMLGSGNRAIYEQALSWTDHPGLVPLSLYPLGTALSGLQALVCLGIFMLVVFLLHSRRRRLVLAWSLLAVRV